jgi:membrane protein
MVETVRNSAPGRFVQRLFDDRIGTLASLVAWGTLNTLLPLILGVLALATLLLGNSPQVDAAEAAVLSLLPAEAAAVFDAAIQAARSAAGPTGLIGLGILLVNGTNFFTSLETVFNLAYHVPDRDFVRQRLVALGGLFVLTCLVLTSTAAAASTGVGMEFSVLGVLTMFVLLYWILPNTHLRPRQSLPGAIVATVCFLAILRLFPLYVALFGQGFSVYSAFGTVLLVMFWLYLVGVVVVGGVELNAFLTTH